MSLNEQYVSISEGRASRYKIVSDTDPLQTIKSLVENDAIGWKKPGTDRKREIR
ncbi:hypothetical protein [Lentibacillus cibarius]|uniref:hypothetical protein n=1 Tax=Lentibacillus cibarius TaxID=2583219 RepID=UPI00163D4459|nr:hypothetical protein [Lentibacillus cibarius]